MTFLVLLISVTYYINLCHFTSIASFSNNKLFTNLYPIQPCSDNYLHFHSYLPIRYKKYKQPLVIAFTDAAILMLGNQYR